MDTPERSWRWSPTVFAARWGQDLVVLDVSRDDYLVLAGAGAWTDMDLATGGLEIGDDGLAAQLGDSGLILAGSKPAMVQRRTAPEAREDIFANAPQRPHLGDMLAFAWVMVEMIPLYWLRSFPRLVHLQERPNGEDAPQPSEALTRSALVFERMLVWAPFQGKCLFRTAMLRRFLHRRGLRAAWVFGVRTWPFSAHCWLQVGGVVINDRVDHVAGFAPVMVV